MIALRAIAGIATALVGLFGTYNLFVRPASRLAEFPGSNIIAFAGPLLFVAGLVIFAFSFRKAASTSRIAKAKVLLLLGAILIVSGPVGLLVAAMSNDEAFGIIAAISFILLAFPGIIFLIVGLVVRRKARAQPDA